MLAGLFSVLGQPLTPAKIGEVVPGSAAEKAGLQPSDAFLRIDGADIESFEQVRQFVQMAPGRNIEIVVRRAGKEITLTATPGTTEIAWFGTTQKIGQLGVRQASRDIVMVRHDPVNAVWRATVRTFNLIGDILVAVGEMVSGSRTAKELGGPVKIAQMSGAICQSGLLNCVQFAVILSINLGLINLFPIPVLDGGHLLFYGIEAIRGRPVGERAMGFSLNVGLALILSLTLFVTWNDLVHLGFVEYLVGLVT